MVHYHPSLLMIGNYYSELGFPIAERFVIQPLRSQGGIFYYEDCYIHADPWSTIRRSTKDQIRGFLFPSVGYERFPIPPSALPGSLLGLSELLCDHSASQIVDSSISRPRSTRFPLPCYQVEGPRRRGPDRLPSGVRPSYLQFKSFSTYLIPLTPPATCHLTYAPRSTMARRALPTSNQILCSHQRKSTP